MTLLANNINEIKIDTELILLYTESIWKRILIRLIIYFIYLSEMEKKEKKSELEWRKYWKNKAEKLQRENLMLKQRIMYLELALNVWSEWHSELLVGQNYVYDAKQVRDIC